MNLNVNCGMLYYLNLVILIVVLVVIAISIVVSFSKYVTITSTM